MTPDTVSEAGSLKSRSRRTLPYLPPEEPAPLPTQAKKHQERMRYTKKAVIFKGNENKKRRSSYALKLENNFYFANMLLLLGLPHNDVFVFCQNLLTTQLLLILTNTLSADRSLCNVPLSLRSIMLIIVSGILIKS